MNSPRWSTEYNNFIIRKICIYCLHESLNKENKILLSYSSKILNNEQINNWITLKSKPITKKTLYFLKNCINNNI